MICHVRSEPRLRRRTAAALINELPVVGIERLCDQLTELGELRSIVTIRRHRFRNAVRRKNEMCRTRATEFAECRADVIYVSLDKQRVIIERPQFLDSWRIWSNPGPRVADVLQILPATGVGSVSGCDKSKRVLNTVRSHATESVGQQRMPVAIAP